MADEATSHGQHRRPHAGGMSGPFLELDLLREVAQLRQEPEWGSGQNARTLVKYDDLRVVLTTLAAGARLPGHSTRGRITIHALSGHLRVRTTERTFDLPAGRLLALDQDVPHDVEALEESAFLLTHATRGTVSASAFGKSTLFSRCTCACRSASNASSSRRLMRYVVHPSSGTAKF